jgi:hypothetical protein
MWPLPSLIVPRLIVIVVESPPRLRRENLEREMGSAFQPFREYIRYLAEGKLDAYLDAVDPDVKFVVPGINMSTRPNLLLHELGQRCDMKRIEQLFSQGTMYLISISCLHGAT